MSVVLGREPFCEEVSQIEQRNVDVDNAYFGFKQHKVFYLKDFSGRVVRVTFDGHEYKECFEDRPVRNPML